MLPVSWGIAPRISWGLTEGQGHWQGSPITAGIATFSKVSNDNKILKVKSSNSF